MIILTLRTDNPSAEIGLYNDRTQLAYKTWPAHRQLAETIHAEIATILNSQKFELSSLEGIIVYRGPGSFTGLRIGMSVANALAASFEIPVVAQGDRWIEDGIARLLAGETDTVAIPEYGGQIHITQPKK